MKLADMPGKQKQSKMSRVPESVREQLIHAYRHDTHSIATMVAWAQAEGHDVSRNSMDSWFASLPYTRGDAVNNG